jgi:hypothetical protein
MSIHMAVCGQKNHPANTYSIIKVLLSAATFFRYELKKKLQRYCITPN